MRQCNLVIKSASTTMILLFSHYPKNVYCKLANAYRVVRMPFDCPTVIVLHLINSAFYIPEWIPPVFQ